ncbi:2-amino-4-hydroxy-6-hydroxymethyldihydropteridine diphosphokinase [Halorhodospira halophila]|uniref:2-amino-4-hydroxy-6-hydroxymethyldihydropteridine pyrophosphokinase n=1 Tax=Halorhodospira halophila (strain DSM 244 / SL1) TaxID=349124 RepID=A1WUU6_HALHL|nr:2-amino-4-hydroxy-6-hydroxymethyldihydropteridine diphosphokinase [Halorhodospira halophila]ABM61458.1 2-amino-4-hydroxy-6-hydroxymethyldihydropteridine pyrophosphokinase [Halorhodospira halophila SL1]MBK1728705.1 2-amino-4-hydroxy-6-hydroxymethyldihydropteridine diphosphokinase [Halorhodospira halophila]
MSTAITAYVGLGSNLDQPRRQIERAVVRLDLLPGCRVRAVSSLYRNPALQAPGVPPQPDFINAVAAVETRQGPLALLDALLGIEAEHQRRRDGVRWGPRTLDLDLLLYGQMQVEEPRLQVPHPELSQRPFVVHPLLEIAPGVRLPGAGALADAAAAVAADTLERIGAVAGFEHVSVQELA